MILVRLYLYWVAIGGLFWGIAVFLMSIPLSCGQKKDSYFIGYIYMERFIKSGLDWFHVRFDFVGVKMNRCSVLF